MTDRTALSYWFPKIEAAGLPVPRTILVEMAPQALIDFYDALDFAPLSADAKAFIRDVQEAADRVGYPAFLRSDHTSGKHRWKDTCFLPGRDVVWEHVMSILEFTSIMDIPDSKFWAVREMLMDPLGFCPRYGDMPVMREMRYFVHDGDVLCVHPYWPYDALQAGGCNIVPAAYAKLCEDPGSEVAEIASKAGAAVGGYWSVDLLMTKRGWCLIDMAEGEKSFHWKGCEIRP